MELAEMLFCVASDFAGNCNWLIRLSPHLLPRTWRKRLHHFSSAVYYDRRM